MNYLRKGFIPNIQLHFKKGDDESQHFGVTKQIIIERGFYGNEHSFFSLELELYDGLPFEFKHDILNNIRGLALYVKNTEEPFNVGSTKYIRKGKYLSIDLINLPYWLILDIETIVIKY